MTRDQLAKRVQEFCDAGAHKTEGERWCTEREMRVDILKDFLEYLNFKQDQMPNVTEDDGQVADSVIAEWAGLHYGANFSTCTPVQKQAWRERYDELHTKDPS